MTARARRGFKGAVLATTVSGGINDSVTTIPGASLATWSGTTTNGPATAIINRLLSDAEEVTFTGVSGGNLTGVTRGTGGTSAQAHADGATLEHASSVTDFDEANELVAAIANYNVRVYNSASLSMSDDTSTVLTFNTERYDTSTLMHDTGSHTGRLVAPIAGVYRVTAHVVWAANATGYRQVLLYQGDASTVIGAVQGPGMASTPIIQSVTTEWRFAANEWATVYARQTSGGSLNVTAAPAYSPEFMMSFVGF